MTNPPKAFISYSWTTPEHEDWILQLSNQLVENGVDVILDKWHLREGADKYAFMEQMVTDPEVKKVIMVCDQAYADKANKRKGGVGTETQVISSEVYEQVENKKFVPIVKERDENGNAFLPTYLKNRMYIDMSNEEAEMNNFEQLLRWLFDKPLHTKPDLGTPPAFLFEEEPISLGTNAKHRIALQAIKHNKSTSLGAIRDYFETYAKNLNQMKIERIQGVNFVDTIFESIKAFLPFRDEILEVFITIAKYSDNLDIYAELHKFFELLLPYTAMKPADKSSYFEGEQDNLNFIVTELFLYLTAILIKYNKFEELNNLLSQKYYSKELSRIEGFSQNTFNFSEFNPYFKFSGLRGANNENAKGILIQERANKRDVTFDEIAQADFLLYLYSVLHFEGLWAHFSWFPYTSFFFRYGNQPFELFSRSESAKYFAKLKKLIDINSKQELIDLFEKGKAEKGYIPSFGYDSRILPVDLLMNLSKLETTP